MLWMALIFISLILLYPLLVIVTDGRYFGKWLMHWIYDSIGPNIFTAGNEAGQWRELVERLKLRGDERILDIGTAVGDLPLTIAAMPDFHGQVIGIDWARQMIAVAKREALRRGLTNRVHFQIADVRNGLPYDKSEFDVIFCLGLLETLPQAKNTLVEFKRVLKPNGILVLSLYRGWAASSVTLRYDWYEQHLPALGFREFQTAPCRHSQDVIIARF